MNKGQKKYHCVGLGGTFDHFHLGHQWFLDGAAALSDRLIVGVTVDALIQEKANVASIESYDQRVKSVSDYLQFKKILHEIEPLEDVAGPTLTDQSIEAVVLTADTHSGGETINRMRVERGLSSLPLELISLKKVSEIGAISSKNIRAGKSNRVGSVYASVLTADIVINDTQRDAMRVVRGELVSEIAEKDQSRYVVGDSTLQRFIAQQESYNLAVIDGKIERQAYSPLVIDQASIELTLVNPAGTISAMMSHGLQLALDRQLHHVYVDGEEDLAAVVLQLLLPLGSTIYYGQPGVGLVRWQVTETEKESIALLLDSHFQTKPKLVE
jgi:cytidyltransferase-like protein